MLYPKNEALIQQIRSALVVDHQYTRLVEGWSHELVVQIRRCGRGAWGWLDVDRCQQLRSG